MPKATFVGVAIALRGDRGLELLPNTLRGLTRDVVAIALRGDRGLELQRAIAQRLLAEVAIALRGDRGLERDCFHAGGDPHQM